jgi:hypothetical protein
MKVKIIYITFLFFACIFNCSETLASLKMPVLFSNNMVLQQKTGSDKLGEWL